MTEIDLQKQLDEIKSELAIFKRHEHFFDGERLRIGSLQDDIDENEITLSDVTTNDVSTTKHGFCPILSNTVTEFFNGQGAFSTPAAGGLSLTKGTIADNDNVAVSTGAGTNTDTVVTHGLGTTPVKVTISASVLAIGKPASTGGSNKRGYAIAVYDTSSSDPILISGHVYINKNDDAADIATTRDLRITGANAFLVAGTSDASANQETIKIQIVSIGATQFTFRINGVVVGTPEAEDSSVKYISWVAEA